MRAFFPLVFSIVMIAILSTIELLLLRALHPEWWKRRWVRRISFSLPGAGFFFLGLWAIGIFLGVRILASAGAVGTMVALVSGVALMVSLPFSGALHAVDSWLERRHLRRREVPLEDVPAHPGRRRILTAAAAAFPVAALAAGGKGLSGAFQEPLIPEIPLHFALLPPAFEGIRIAHISDVHLGMILGLQDLEHMVARLILRSPDLVLVTGDIADDTAIYLDALRIIGSIPARFGIHASIGNHEYYRGIAEILRAYERGPIPLLLDAGARIDADTSCIWLAGADDPRSLGTIPSAFFPRTFERAMINAPADAFTILMSHRPEGFFEAARHGVPLTISGHTHGGQIAIGGRSMLEYFLPEKHMWGHYRHGASQLYVSAGAGHWFPWRFGVPPEIPIYVLSAQRF